MTIEYEQALWIEFGDRMRLPYNHAIPAGDRMSRPKDQDQDEPAMRAINDPPPTQTRSLGWTGYQLTVAELRNFLDRIPNQATIHLFADKGQHSQWTIVAEWEVP